MSGAAKIVRRHRPDFKLFAVAGLLLLISLVIIYAVSPALTQEAGVGDNYYIIRQLLHIFLGVAAFAITALIPIKAMRKVQLYIFIITAILVLAVLVPGLGTTVNGAKRWIEIGPITLQPSEFIKLSLTLFMASFLSSRIKDGDLDDLKRTILPLSGLLGLIGFVVVILEKDLGTMISIVAIFMGIMYVAGIAWRYLAALVGGLGMLAAMAVLIAPHRLARITAFLGDSSSDSTYHIDQALIAVGSGGFAGKGLGRSVQVFGYLPEAETDSIFAILAEKFGFIGGLVVLGVYGFLMIRILRIMQNSPSLYFRFIVTGILSWIGAHIVINIGAMLGMLPITGITLPLLSIGGTSLLSIMAALGIVFQISRYTIRDRTKTAKHTVVDEYNERKSPIKKQATNTRSSRRGNGRSYNTANSSGRRVQKRIPTI